MIKDLIRSSSENAADDDRAGDVQDKDRKGALDAMVAAGIGEPTRSKLLAEIPGLGAAAILKLKPRNPKAGIGVWINSIRSDGNRVVAEIHAAKKLAVEAEAEARDEREAEGNSMSAPASGDCA